MDAVIDSENKCGCAYHDCQAVRAVGRGKCNHCAKLRCSRSIKRKAELWAGISPELRQRLDHQARGIEYLKHLLHTDQLSRQNAMDARRQMLHHHMPALCAITCVSTKAELHGALQGLILLNIGDPCACDTCGVSLAVVGWTKTSPVTGVCLSCATRIKDIELAYEIHCAERDVPMGDLQTSVPRSSSRYVTFARAEETNGDAGVDQSRLKRPAFHARAAAAGPCHWGPRHPPVRVQEDVLRGVPAGVPGKSRNRGSGGAVVGEVLLAWPAGGSRHCRDQESAKEHQAMPVRTTREATARVAVGTALTIRHEHEHEGLWPRTRVTEPFRSLITLIINGMSQSWSDPHIDHAGGYNIALGVNVPGEWESNTTEPLALWVVAHPNKAADMMEWWASRPKGRKGKAVLWTFTGIHAERTSTPVQ